MFGPLSLDSFLPHVVPASWGDGINYPTVGSHNLGIHDPQVDEISGRLIDV